jgi:LPXTG-motif cell wall-anchored protein
LVALTALTGLAATVSPALSAIAAAADPASADDIRDIRGPKGIFPLWLVLAGVTAALLLALGAYFLWRRKQRLPAVRPLLPFEIALQGLEQIRALMDPSKVREFSIAISDIVRKYIEDAFHLIATHRTTEEFLRDLLQSSNTALAAHRGLLAEFLNQCDMAKFAGVSLSRQIIESLHQSARTFVIESSKPLPAATAPGSAHPRADSTTPRIGSTPPLAGATPARTTTKGG